MVLLKSIISLLHLSHVLEVSMKYYASFLSPTLAVARTAVLGAVYPLLSADKPAHFPSLSVEPLPSISVFSPKLRLYL